MRYNIAISNLSVFDRCHADVCILLRRVICRRISPSGCHGTGCIYHALAQDQRRPIWDAGQIIVICLRPRPCDFILVVFLQQPDTEIPSFANAQLSNHPALDCLILNHIVRRPVCAFPGIVVVSPRQLSRCGSLPRPVPSDPDRIALRSLFQRQPRRRPCQDIGI